MTTEVAKKFIEAAEAVGIKNYEFDTDIGTHLYNHDFAIIKLVEADEVVYNIRSSHYAGSHNTYNSPVQVVAANTNDIHEARIAGDHKQIQEFLNHLGVIIDEDDLKIILKIETANSNIIPETGDYNRFQPLSKKQYDSLSDEHKKEYDAAKEADDKKKHDYIGGHAAASISLG